MRKSTYNAKVTYVKRMRAFLLQKLDQESGQRKQRIQRLINRIDREEGRGFPILTLLPLILAIIQLIVQFWPKENVE